MTENKETKMKRLAIPILTLLVFSCDEVLESVVEGCTTSTACNFNSTATKDDGSCEYAEGNFDCDGNCVAAIDCAGDCGGISVADNCGTCDGDSLNDCIIDCAGKWGGEAAIDDCGICTGGTTGVNTNYLKDCYGECGGSAGFDNCNNCVGGSTGLTACTQDCNGTWGGLAEIDCVGICGGYHLIEDCGTVNDFDGNIYKTIKIGTQTWMAENLKVIHYNNGDAILTGYSRNEWSLLDYTIEPGAYAFYNNNESFKEIYGILYNWYAITDDRGICPDSFHIPTDDELIELELLLGMSESEVNNSGHRGTNEGSKLAGNIDIWSQGDGDLIEDAEFGISGFNAIPAGHINFTGWSYNLNESTGLWSRTAYSNSHVWSRLLSGYYSDISRNSDHKTSGNSVRCLKD